jgi:hypothetical protein
MYMANVPMHDARESKIGVDQHAFSPRCRVIVRNPSDQRLSASMLSLITCCFIYAAIPQGPIYGKIGTPSNLPLYSDGRVGEHVRQRTAPRNHLQNLGFTRMETLQYHLVPELGNAIRQSVSRGQIAGLHATNSRIYLPCAPPIVCSERHLNPRKLSSKESGRATE